MSRNPLGQLTTQLHWLNGNLLNERLENESGILAVLKRDSVPVAGIVEQIYLRANSRLPSERERDFWAKEIGSDPSEATARKLQDFLWAILSSPEFTSNH